MVFASLALLLASCSGGGEATDDGHDTAGVPDASDGTPEVTASDATPGDVSELDVDGGPRDCGLLGRPCPEGFACTPLPYQVVDNGIEEYCYSADEDAIFVPAGESWIGCDDTGEFLCWPSQQPKHAVTTPAYVMLQTPVTIAQYQDCIDDPSGGCTSPQFYPGRVKEVFSRSPDYPHLLLYKVSWDDANAYCSWLAEETGQHWRLCSESEWEKAARAGCETLEERMAEGESCSEATRLYPWGDSVPTCELAWWAPMCDFADWQTAQSPPPVRSRPASASAYGMLGAFGTVYQWVADCAHASFNGHPTDGSAWTDDCMQFDSGEIARFGRGVPWWCGNDNDVEGPFYNCPLDLGVGGTHDSKKAGIRCCRDFEP